MIYGVGSLEKDKLRLEKTEDEHVYLARMADDQGSYRLLVTSPDLENAKTQVRIWIETQLDEDHIVTVDPYNIDTGEIIF